MKVASVVCSGTQRSNSLVRGGGLIFRPGIGMNYLLFFHCTCMHCGDLNSAHKDFFKVNLVSNY